MIATSDTKRRLHDLLDLARSTKGWTRADLARALRRDPTKLYPESGNPKMDFLVSLSEVLEWPVDDVVAWVRGDSEQAFVNEEESFADLDTEAMAAHRSGEYSKMVDLSKRMFQAAGSPDERALACNREAGGWDGLGRSPKSLDAVRRGLLETPISQQMRLRLQGNLANAYYTLWELTQSLAISEMLVDWHNANPATTDAEKKRPAFALYVRGQTHRRLIETDPAQREMHSDKAHRDLSAAMRMYDELSETLGEPALGGIANTCRGGLIEVEVEQGKLPVSQAIERLMEGLDRVVDTRDSGPADWIESYGWWSVFGGAIALRHLEGRALQQSMAVFTNKALEIADLLENWSLRERVFSMQFALHETMRRSTDFEIDFTIDDEDRRLIAGTMGRFPRFRDVGWRILSTAKLVAAS